MKFSVCQCDITPQRPCWQGGYVQRNQFFEQVHDPITATIFDLKLNCRNLVFITMDVSGVNQTLRNKIMQRTKEKGISLSNQDLVIGATHTHSGPLVNFHNDREPDEQYIIALVEAISDAIVQTCQKEGTEVSINYSNATIDGLYSNRNDKNKISDKIVHLLGFYDKGKLLGLFVTLAHHCTVLGPNFTDLSADLFGEIRRHLQNQFHVPVFMAQGNAGDMGNKQYRKSNLFDEVEMEASQIIDQINKKRTDWKPLKTDWCKDYSFEYKASYDVDASIFEKKKAEFEELLKTETDFDTIKLLVTGISSFERKIKQGFGHLEKVLPWRVYNLEELQIVAIPGELGSILGLRIKKASKAKVCLVWAYVDPCDLGYMVEKEAYGGFSQESNVTDYPAGVPDEFVEAIIKSL